MVEERNKFVAGKGIDCKAGGKEGAERKSFERKEFAEKWENSVGKLERKAM